MKTFCATMEQLRWCRVEDVLRWITKHTDSHSSEKMALYGFAGGLPDTTIDIPCDQFTASVIKRAELSVPTLAHQLHWDRVMYLAETNHLRFMSNKHDGYGFITIYCDPDPTGELTEFKREWVEAVLKGMGLTKT